MEGPLMSDWANPLQSVPETYIFPPDKRPGTHLFPVIDNIPTVDLGNPSRPEIIQQIFQACREFGFFQVTNHGLTGVMEETMNVMKEFFASPAENKAAFYSTEMSSKCRLYSSTLNYDREDVHYWRDNFTHHCHPLGDHIHLWPHKPARYRQVVGEYSVEARRVVMKILELISEGLGLEGGYFEGEMSGTQLLSVNHHIPCPDPRVTLGMPTHSDPNLITMLHQCSVPGLQILHRGQWKNVEPTTHAFIVIPGLQLKVISNGEFLSPIHRVVTHSEEARTTIGTFLIPASEIVIEPARNLSVAPLYKGFTYSEFFNCFTRSNCEADATLLCFKINNHTI